MPDAGFDKKNTSTFTITMVKMKKKELKKILETLEQEVDRESLMEGERLEKAFNDEVKTIKRSIRGIIEKRKRTPLTPAAQKAFLNLIDSYMEFKTAIKNAIP